MKNSEHFRQGDVAISKSKIRDVTTLKEKKSKVQGRVVLAYGEVTGHHHSIDVERYKGVKLYTLDELTDILVVPEEAVVEHQEHGPIPLEAGQYEIHIQVEYDPEGERRVTD